MGKARQPMLETRSSRAGVYRTQPSGYRAFLPAPLPPDPPVQLSGELQGLLSQADRALGRLDGSIQTLPNPDLFVFMYVRKEAVLSSQIEGTQSSLQDLLAAEANAVRPDRPHDVDEVVNYVARHEPRAGEAADAAGVGSAHPARSTRELLKGVRGSQLTPGELRTSQNWIGPGGCTLADGDVRSASAARGARGARRPGALSASRTTCRCSIQIGLAHAAVRDHPPVPRRQWPRRAAADHVPALREAACCTKPVLYLSHYFKRHRQAYYDHLQAVRDRGDWEEWLAFFLRGVPRGQPAGHRHGPSRPARCGSATDRS